MLNPFIDLLAELIHLYMLCVIAWTVVVTLISFKIINAYQPVVQRVMYALNRLCEPALRPIQKILPDLGGIDISPIILLLLLNFVRSALYTYFYSYPHL
ncbi:MAG: YggT family protein [Pseudomonadota bacterium]|nr:YggT family protein [Pseudomonadota bacterium]MDE3037733.1 YggT family protein [Pseudomonadota bacterium]